MNLNAPDPCLLAGRKDADILSLFAQAGDKGTGYYGSKTFQGKYPVHRQAQKIGSLPAFKGCNHADNCCAQCANTITVCRRNGDNWRPFKKGATQIILDIFSNHLQPVFVNNVSFGESNNARTNSKQGTDIKMFPGLGHYPFVRGDYKKHTVNSCSPGDHGFDEAFMARHIDNSQAPSIWQIKPCKAQIYCNAPALFLIQTITIDSCQCAHQGSFSVINMARRAQYRIHRYTL